MNVLNWEIIPKIGLGPIHFSMNSSSIQSIIGPPESKFGTLDGELREYRSMSVLQEDLVLQYDCNQLSVILLHCAPNDICIFGKLLNKDDPEDVFETIKAKNGGFYKYYGDYSFFFDSLGIILHDFLAPDDCEKGMSIWSDAAYAQMIAMMERGATGCEMR